MAFRTLEIRVELLRLFEGRFGRIAIKEVSEGTPQRSLPEYVVLIKYDGADRECYVSGKRGRLGNDGIVFINAMEPISTLDGERSRGIAMYLSPEWLQENFPSAFPPGESRAFSNPFEAITPHIRKLADAMVVDMLNDRFLSADRLEFMVQELMLSVVDSYLAKRRASSPLWRGSRYADYRIRRAIALLRARPNKDVNMDEIAMQVGLSRSRFYDLFQICTGRSPREYLDMLCVETAIARLSSRETKIADVSAELGFSAQSNFTRFFLNQVGASPSEYRRAASGAVVQGPAPSPAFSPSASSGPSTPGRPEDMDPLDTLGAPIPDPKG